MKPVGVTDLKSHLSEHLVRVKAGEEILITERGRPIARLQPLRGEEHWDAHTLDLARRGIVKLPARPLDMKAFLALPRVADPEGAVLKALLAEREEDWR